MEIWKKTLISLIIVAPLFVSFSYFALKGIRPSIPDKHYFYISCDVNDRNIDVHVTDRGLIFFEDKIKVSVRGCLNLSGKGVNKLRS